MNKILISLAIAAGLLAGAGAAPAADGTETVVEEKLVVALKTDHFEIDETDISHLAVGESETVVTGNGRTVELLRTEDGVEVYLDGELLDIPMDGDEQVVREEIEILCDTPEDCEEIRLMSGDGEIDLEALEADGTHKVIRIHRETEVVGGAADADADVDADVDVDETVDTDGRKVIIIRKKTADEI